MTSNIGAELIRKGTAIGFASRSDEVKTREQSYERMKEKLLGELKKAFLPEFLNRIDGQVVFHPLTREQIRSIVDLMLATVSQQLAEKQIKLEVTCDTKDWMGEKGYDEIYGARPLRRVIQDNIEDKLSEAVLREEFKVFEAVYETRATIENPDVMAAVSGAVRKMENVLSMDSSEKVLTIFSHDSMQADLVTLIKDQTKELSKDEAEAKGRVKADKEPDVAEKSYVSYVVVDMKDGEIFIDSRDNFVLPNLAVGAA
jgi:hypothetical protein